MPVRLPPCFLISFDPSLIDTHYIEAEKEIIGFTQALLQSTDPTTLANFFDPSEEESNPESAIPALDLDTESLQSDRKLPTPRSRHSSRASSPPPRPVSISSLQSLHAESGIAPSPDDGVFHASPKQFSLKIGGKVHVFELSLCGSEDFGHEQVCPAFSAFMSYLKAHLHFTGLCR